MKAFSKGDSECPSLAGDSLLICGEDAEVLHRLRGVLERAGYRCAETALGKDQGVERVSSGDLAAVVLHFPGSPLEAEEMLARLSERSPELPVVVMAAGEAGPAAGNFIQLGAVDCLAAFGAEERLIRVLDLAITRLLLSRENRRLKKSLLGCRERPAAAFTEVVTQSPRMEALLRYCEAVAPLPAPLLLSGEPGVGKGLFAKEFHAASGLSGRFVSLSLRGLEDATLAGALFGGIRDETTGGRVGSASLIDEASGGTLYIDDISGIGVSVQTKLLRLIRGREYCPIGSTQPRISRARCIFSSNTVLQDREESGDFRRDLVFELQRREIHIPPLRERREDIPLLLNHFFIQAAKAMGRKPRDPTPELLEKLLVYNFPGNVRELKALVYDAVAGRTSGGPVMSAFEKAMEPRAGGGGTRTGTEIAFAAALQAPAALPTLRRAEAAIVEEALRRAGGNQALAARMLGLSRQALNRRLRKSRGKS